MWKQISQNIIKYRVFLVIFLGIITGLLAYKSKDAELSYDFRSVVPADDPELIYFNNFKKLFGDDGTVMAIGVRGDKIYQLDKFNQFSDLAQSISKMAGVTQVIALSRMPYLSKDTIQKKFVAKAIFPKKLTSQIQLDSLLKLARQQKIYENLLFNPKNGATLILVTIDKKVLDTPIRQKLVEEIIKQGEQFSQNTDIELYYGGLPYIRSAISKMVQAELKKLLILSGIATAIILYVFFGNLMGVLIPLIVIGMVVVWALGFLALFGYKITMLSSLLPPILVVIGVPNCVYLLNKYHQEYRRTQDKITALEHIIEKIGIVTLMTNLTTAIGFGVFVFTDNEILRQFGVISGISVMATFFVSIILFPVLFSFLPAPSAHQLKHLDRKPLHKMLMFLENTVFYYRGWIYGIVLFLTVISLLGVFQVRALSFMLDNVPNDSKPKNDLKFFEANFNGIMPLEILIDTKRKKGVMDLKNLRKADELEQKLAQVNLIGRPLSMVSLIKGSTQAYYNNLPEFYVLPTNRDKVFIINYLSGGQDSTGTRLLRTMVDSTGQKMRISLKVADVGSMRLDTLINKTIKPIIKEVYKDSKTEVSVTGTTLIFIKGNLYLINSLQSSLILAVVLIGLIMATLFGSFRMIIISVLTNLLPLVITAGLMGYFNIPLKPSTALIFSIAFGIAVDDSIHYLARYRQELKLNNYSVPTSVRISLRETGAGMFYTSIVLFCGFIVFTISNFEGTLVLGALTATTLLVAMVGNLMLLPALLLTFDTGKYDKKKQLIDYYDEDFHFEEDDEELDLSLIKVQKNDEN